MAKKKRGLSRLQEDSSDSSSGVIVRNDDKNPRNHFEGFPLDLILSKDQFQRQTKNKQWKLQELSPRQYVWTIPLFFTSTECQNWIKFCEVNHVLEYTSHPASKYIAHRECYRIQQPNAIGLATRIFDRLQQTSILQQIQQQTSDLYSMHYSPIGCNPNLRLYKYEKGHAFSKHVDESNIIGIENSNDFLLGAKTEMTMLIYLSECQGGATRFHINRNSKGKTKKSASSSSSSSSSFAFEPQIGTLLLHVHGEHCLEHEADPVIDGNKYVLRTDLVFGSNNADSNR